MFDFHEKRKIRRFLYSKFFIGFIILLVLVLGKSAYERYKVEREMAEKLSERMEELEELKNRATLLEARVDHLKNDRGIEDEIRSRFDVVREGEQVVVILDDPKGKENSPKIATSTEEKKSFFSRFIFW